LLQQQMSERRRRSHSRSERVTRNTALQDRDVFLQCHSRWILRARILETFMLADAFLHVCGGLIDRNRYSACCRVRFLSGVDCISSKAHSPLSSHKKAQKIEGRTSELPGVQEFGGASLDLLLREVVVPIHENGAGLGSVGWPDDSITFHRVEQTCGTAVADSKTPLQD
jgi:hypothetical protein